LNGSPETERERKTRRLIEELEAFQLLCKQIDRHAGELLEVCREETKE
jgi:hypothetical protein